MKDFEIVKLTVGQLKENCYLLYCKSTKECLIIDPGEAGEYISSEIQKRSLKPIKIIATHGHFDHISAATYLKLNFKVPFLINKKDEFLVQRMQETSIHFSKIDPGPNPQIDNYLEPGDKLKIGKKQVKVMETPGHSPGSVSFYLPGMIFVGDVLFKNGQRGSSEFKYQNKSTLRKSIKKILSLPENTIIYSGHGEPTVVVNERKYYF